MWLNIWGRASGASRLGWTLDEVIEANEVTEGRGRGDSGREGYGRGGADGGAWIREGALGVGTRGRQRRRAVEEAEQEYKEVFGPHCGAKTEWMRDVRRLYRCRIGNSCSVFYVCWKLATV
jgi:hypothetical protein